jgi:hypothetical protein
MLCRLEGRTFNWQRATRRELLTVHDLPHTLDKAVYDLESLSCGSPGLVLSQSVKPLQGRLDFLLSENLLHKFDYIVLGERVYASERKTHLIDPALAPWSPARVL